MRDSLHYDPCEECGEQDFIQEVRQSEDVILDENGDPSCFEPRGSVTIERLYCVNCDEAVFIYEDE